MSGSGKKRVPEVATAMHILKGAVVSVLHTPITTSVEAHKANEGRLTVQYDGAEKPSDEDLARIISLANAKIAEDVPVTITSMSRGDAEAKYKAAPVNETFIYDRFKVPDEVLELSILEIENWTVNATSGTHLESTGKVRPLVLKNINFRPQKNELQIVVGFDDAAAAGAAPAAKAAPKAAAKADPKAAGKKAAAGKGGKAEAPAQKPATADPLATASDRIYAGVLAALKSIDNEKYGQLTADQLRGAADADVKGALQGLRNAAYTQGFASTQNVSKAPRT